MFNPIASRASHYLRLLSPLILVPLILTFPSLLQAQGTAEPLFRIRVQQTGRSDEASYTSTLDRAYAPCGLWVGGSGGGMGTPAEFLANAGGLGGVRPGQAFPFYAKAFSGSAQGSDGSTATVVTIGDGLGLWTERDANGTSTKQDNPADRPSHNMSARFERTATGARITFDAGLVSAGHGSYIGMVQVHQMEVDPALVQRFCTFEVTQEELKNWKQIQKKQTQTFSDDNGQVIATATLFVEIEEPAEVQVEVEGYDQWIPQGNVEDPGRAGNTVRVKAKVLAKEGRERKAKITFTLKNVSTEPGVCMNGPAAEGWDLKFLKEENPRLDPGLSPWEAKTQDLVTEAEATISCFDFGAFAQLQVTAEDKDGKPLKVTLQGKERAGLSLPKDELGGHIADAWRIQKGVQGLPATWDEAIVEGQQEKGDGLPLYQKYRGFLVVGANGRTYTRLEPREKSHFVIDPKGVLDAAQWRKATGIRLYKVFESWTQAGRANMHQGYTTTASKWAVRFAVDETEVDENASAEALTVMRMQWAMTVGTADVTAWKPSDVELCTILPGRIHYTFRYIRDLMLRSLQAPSNQDEREVGAWLLTLGLPKAELIARLRAISNADIAARTTPLIRWAALHECAHSCGLQGHLNAEGKESQNCLSPVPSCPMQYPNWQDKMRFLLFGEITGQGPCCRTAPHLCWTHLSPKG